MLGLLFVMGGGNNFYTWGYTVPLVRDRLALALPCALPEAVAPILLAAASTWQARICSVCGSVQVRKLECEFAGADHWFHRVHLWLWWAGRDAPRRAIFDTISDSDYVYSTRFLGHTEVSPHPKCVISAALTISPFRYTASPRPRKNQWEAAGCAQGGIAASAPIATFATPQVCVPCCDCSIY